MDNLPENQNLQKEKKIPSRLVIFILIAVAFGMAGYYFSEKEKNQKLPTTPPLSQKSFPYNTLPLNKIPDAFPYDIPVPVEPPNLLLLSYSQIVGNKEQTTIQFISSKSAAETLKLYKTYFKEKGWTIMSTIDKSTLKSLSVKKEKTFLSVTINSKNLGEGDLVDLTIIIPKKQTTPLPGFQTNTPK
jgi:hypothetical protein